MSNYPKIGKEWPGSMNYPQSTFYHAIACDEIKGHLSVGKFGSNDAAGTSETIIWSGAAVPSSNPFPAAAAKVLVRAGGNASDDDGGTGANSITIYGLNATWDIVSETILLAGAAASAQSTNSYIRVYRVAVTSGSGGVNVAAIILDQVAGECIAHVQAGKGQSTQCFYPVPRGYKAHVPIIEAYVDSNKVALIQMWQRVSANTATPSKRLVQELFGIIGGARSAFDLPKQFPEYTDVYMTSVAGAAGSGISGMFDVILIKNGS